MSHDASLFRDKNDYKICFECVFVGSVWKELKPSQKVSAYFVGDLANCTTVSLQDVCFPPRRL